MAPRRGAPKIVFALVRRLVYSLARPSAKMARQLRIRPFSLTVAMSFCVDVRYFRDGYHTHWIQFTNSPAQRSLIGALLRGGPLPAPYVRPGLVSVALQRPRRIDARGPPGGKRAGDEGDQHQQGDRGGEVDAV